MCVPTGDLESLIDVILKVDCAFSLTFPNKSWTTELAFRWHEKHYSFSRLAVPHAVCRSTISRVHDGAGFTTAVSRVGDV